MMREPARPVSQPSTPDNELGPFFKALSDDTRREILALLERRERNVTEIVRRAREIAASLSGTSPLVLSHGDLNPGNVIVARDALKFTDLPSGARVGTGSPRRMGSAI